MVLIALWPPVSFPNPEAPGPLSLSEEERAWLARHPVIPILVDGDWPPIDFMDASGRHQGIAADVIQHLEALLGVRFAVHPEPDFKTMLAQVVEGRAKVAVSIVNTPERAELLEFSAPFFKVLRVIVTRRDETGIHRIADLAGRTVAVEDGVFTMRQLQQRYPEIRLKPVPTTLDALQAVSWGQADAYVGNRAAAQWLIQENQLLNLVFRGDGATGPADLCFAVHPEPEWKPLIALIDKGLAAMGHAERQTIVHRWLPIGEEPAERPPLSLTSEERNWLREHPRIRLGVDPAWPPIEYLGPKGEYLGIASEYIRYFSERLGIPMEPVPDLTWEQVIQGVTQGTIDLLPAVVSSKARERYLHFTRPYLSFPLMIFNSDADTFITGLDDLAGRSVAVETDYITQEYLTRDYPRIRQVEVPNALEGLRMASTGAVYAYVGNLAVGSYLISRYGLTNVKVAAPTPYRFDLAMGVRKDWPSLVSLLDRLIREMPEWQRLAIRRKWLAVRYDVAMDYRYLWWVLGATSVFLLLGLLWLLRIRRAQRELRHRKEQLETLIHTVPLAIFLFDRQGTILLANRYADRVYRSDGVRLLGRNLREFYETPDSCREMLSQLADRGRITDQPTRFRSGTGKRIEGLLSAVLIHLDQEPLVLGVLVDLTERLRMERALEEARAAAEKANAFKSHFLANMSHEIRTPMNAILGMAHLALQTDLSLKQFDYINKIQYSAQNLLRIINDILDFSKIEAGRLEIEETDFFLDELLDHLIALVHLRAEEKKLELILQRDPRIPNALIGDPLRLAQVLLNLVQNAIRFTESGHVMIAVRLGARDTARAHLDFSVCDTGIGIEPKSLQHLFEPFVQANRDTSRKYGGTGLGLSISQQLVGLMGGVLTAQSTPGKGSCFRFRLGLRVQQGADRLPQRAVSDLRDLSVLVVDDNPIVRQVLKEFLLSFSFQVVLAASATEAYARLQEAEAERPIDLILLDWKLSDTDGIEAAHHIRTHLPLHSPPKILLVTAYNREEIRQQVADEALDGFLLKPVNPSILFDTIASLFHPDPGASARKPTATPSRSDLPRLAGRVLLVEDNEINQQVARELLEAHGVRVQIAGDGREALEALENYPFDLIFMDVRMPEMDGYEATRRIRARPGFADLPIIAMTAHAMSGDRERCLEAGMNDYLSKPIDPKRLSEMLQRWLGTPCTRISEEPRERFDADLPEGSAVLDLRWGLQRVGGNRTLYRKLLQDFQARHLPQCGDLSELPRAGDRETAGRIAHTLQGVAGNLGAHALAAAALALDQRIRRGREPSHVLLAELRKAADCLAQEVSRVLAQWPRSKDPSAVESARGSGAISGEHLETLARYLREGDARAGTFFTEIPFPDSVAEAQKRLQDQIEEYEYEDALETLAQIADCLPIHPQGLAPHEPTG